MSHGNSNQFYTISLAVVIALLIFSSIEFDKYRKTDEGKLSLRQNPWWGFLLSWGAGIFVSVTAILVILFTWAEARGFFDKQKKPESLL